MDIIEFIVNLRDVWFYTGLGTALVFIILFLIQYFIKKYIGIHWIVSVFLELSAIATMMSTLGVGHIYNGRTWRGVTLAISWFIYRFIATGVVGLVYWYTTNLIMAFISLILVYFTPVLGSAYWAYKDAKKLS